MPAPRISSQPPPRQTRQSGSGAPPAAAHAVQAMSTSALGSVKGKKLGRKRTPVSGPKKRRSEEHTSELQSRLHLVCRLLLEKKKKKKQQKSKDAKRR